MKHILFLSIGLGLTCSLAAQTDVLPAQTDALSAQTNALSAHTDVLSAQTDALPAQTDSLPAQKIAPGVPENFNDSIAHARYDLTEKAMLILGDWSVVNIASGFIIAGSTHGEASYAWRMNGYWNLVNLGLAGMGYLNARKAALRKYSFSDNYEAQHSIEKLYILNFGLDLTYITAGLYLRERGNSAGTIKSREQLRGYGSSILIQGGFLLLMDGLMIHWHQKNTSRMNKRLRQLDLGAGPDGLGVSYTF